MSSPSYLQGEWVWCRFPEAEGGRKDQPGPKLRIAYVLVATGNKASEVVVMAYTTSSIPRNISQQPKGTRDFDLQQARQQGQQVPFRLDARRIAYMPATEDFFPFIHRPDRGVVGRAGDGLQRAIRDLVREVANARLIQTTGPARPR